MGCDIYDSSIRKTVEVFGEPRQILFEHTKKKLWNGNPEHNIPPQEVEVFCNKRWHIWTDNDGAEHSTFCPFYEEDRILNNEITKMRKEWKTGKESA